SVGLCDPTNQIEDCSQGLALPDDLQEVFWFALLGGVIRVVGVCHTHPATRAVSKIPTLRVISASLRSGWRKPKKSFARSKDLKGSMGANGAHARSGAGIDGRIREPARASWGGANPPFVRPANPQSIFDIDAEVDR